MPITNTPDDRKHQHGVKLWLTDREFLDLAKLADAEDRSPGELGRVIVRRFMYGSVGTAAFDFNQMQRADKGSE